MDVVRPVEEERGLIAAVASGDPEKMKASDVIFPEDFADADCRRIFEGCKSLWARRCNISLAALDSELTRMHGQESAAVLMSVVLNAMSENALRAWQLPTFIQTIREGSARRKLIAVGERLAAGAADPQQDFGVVVDDARTALRKSVVGSGGRWFTAADAALAAYDAAEHQQRPIVTGIAELDAILCGGLHKGELTILGARPACGKSALLLSLAFNAAASGARAMLVSMEMSEQQIGARILARESGFNPALLRSGEEIAPDAWADLADALLQIDSEAAERVSFLVDGSLTVEQLRQEVQAKVDSGECDLLLIDYMQLLHTKRKTVSEFEQISFVSRALKSLTLDLDVAVVAAAQVRRQANGGVLRAPSLDELRGSGSIEQDADNVILLHRPETPDDPVLKGRSYDRVSGAFERAQAAGKQLLSLDVAKQRQGRTARAWTVFDGSRMRFQDPSEV